MKKTDKEAKPKKIAFMGRCARRVEFTIHPKGEKPKRVSFLDRR